MSSRFFASLESSGSESENDQLEVVKKNKFMNSDISESEEGSEFSGYSDSDSDNSSSNEEDNAEEQAVPVRKSRFLMASDSEDEDEGSGKALKSQKEKVADEITSVISLITDSVSNDDWNGANINYDRLTKLASKGQKYGISKEFFVFLNEFETQSLAKLSGADVKSMEKENAKAFNALRQKSRKIVAAYAGDIKRHTSDGASTASTEDITETLKLPKFGKIEEVVRGDGAKIIELTVENVTKKLQEIISSRGRKNVDRYENLNTLKKLFNLANTSEKKIQILNAQISTEFDISSLGASLNMPHGLWISALQNIKCMLDLLLNDPKFIEDSSSSSDSADGEDSSFFGLPTVAGIRGTFSSYMYRIDDEYIRALQNIDAHSGEYLEFLKCEPDLAAVLLKSRLFFSAIRNPEAESQVLVRYLEHVYYKTETDLQKCSLNQLSPQEAVASLSEKTIDRLKQKAQLFLIHHLALMGNYKAARDIFVSNRFQDLLPSLEMPLPIYYNRALVQLGLCAFNEGFIKDAYFSLQEICSTGRPKELLAQGVQTQRFAEKSPEQERAERQLQLPAHLHLNVELIDCVFLTCSMILEVPQTAFFSKKTHPQDRKLYQSRHLRRLMDAADRNIYSGPPENTRESLLTAARHLSEADWESTVKFCLGPQVWKNIPEFESKVKPTIVDKIKESALCTFIYIFSSSFESLGLEYLASTFEMETSAVTHLVSRILQETGLPANLDETQKFLVCKSNVQLSKVQELGAILVDKIQVILDRNEETADFLHIRPAHKA